MAHVAATNDAQRQRQDVAAWETTASDVEKLERSLANFRSSDPELTEQMRARSAELKDLRETIAAQVRDLDPTQPPALASLRESLGTLRQSCTDATGALADVGQRTAPFAIGNAQAQDKTFGSAYYFDTAANDRVTIGYAATGPFQMSGDISTDRMTSGRHLHGLLKTSRVNLPDGSLRHFVQLEPRFQGSVAISVNGQQRTIQQSMNQPAELVGGNVPRVSIDPDRIVTGFIREHEQQQRQIDAAQRPSRTQPPRRDEPLRPVQRPAQDVRPSTDRTPPPTIVESRQEPLRTQTPTLPRQVPTTEISGIDGQPTLQISDPALMQSLVQARRAGFEIQVLDSSDTGVAFQLKRGGQLLYPPLRLAGALSEPTAEQGSAQLSPSQLAELRQFVARTTTPSAVSLSLQGAAATSALPLTQADGQLYDRLKRELNRSDQRYHLALTEVSPDGDATYRYYCSNERIGNSVLATRWASEPITIAAGQEASRNSQLLSELDRLRESSAILVPGSGNTTGVAIDPRLHAGLHQAIREAEASGLNVRVVSERRADGNRAAVSLQASVSQAGNQSSLSVGSPIEVRLADGADNAQAVSSLQDLAQHVPVPISCRVPGVSASPVTAESDPSTWQALDDARREGISVVVTNREYRSGRAVFTYELFHQNDPNRSLSGPITVSTTATDYHAERNELLKAALARVSAGEGRLESASLGTRGQTETYYAATRPQTVAALSVAREHGIQITPTLHTDGSMTYAFRSTHHNRDANFSVKLSADDLSTVAKADAAFGREVGWAVGRLQHSYEFLVTDYEKTSKAFRQEVRQALSELPTAVVDRLLKEGYTIHAQQYMTQVERPLSERPRGYAPESSWNHARGVLIPSSKLIVLNERFLPTKRKTPTGASESAATDVAQASAPEWSSAVDTAGSTLRHEVGHAVSYVLGQDMIRGESLDASRFQRLQSHGASSSASFERAYLSDHSQLMAYVPESSEGSGSESGASPEHPKQALSYFLQAGDDNRFDAGMSECFAECVLVLLQGEECRSYNHFQGHFPNALDATEKILRERFGLTDEQLPGSTRVSR